MYNKINYDITKFTTMLNINKDINDKNKNIKDFLNKYSLFNNLLYNKDDVNIRPNLINTFMNKILGYSEFTNYDVPFIYLNNLEGIKNLNIIDFQHR